MKYYNYEVTYSISNAEFGNYSATFTCIINTKIEPCKLEEIDLINILGNLLSIKEDRIISITHVFIGNKFIPLN